MASKRKHLTIDEDAEILTKRQISSTSLKDGPGALCDLERVVTVIRGFTSEKKKVLEELGFGSILGYNCVSLRRNMCFWMIEHFDPSTTSISVHGTKTTLTPKHVELMLGFDDNGVEIMEDVDGIDVSDLVSRYGNMSIEQMQSQLQRISADDDDFKRVLVLFLMTTFFAPTETRFPKKSWMNLIRDINNVPFFNWAKFILDNLVDGVTKFRENNQADVGGCVLFFMILFCEYSTQEKLDDAYKYKLPRISSWDDNNLKGLFQYITKNLKHTGGFESKKLMFHLEDEKLKIRGNLPRDRLAILEKKMDMLHGEMSYIRKGMDKLLQLALTNLDSRHIGVTSKNSMDLATDAKESTEEHFVAGVVDKKLTEKTFDDGGSEKAEEHQTEKGKEGKKGNNEEPNVEDDVDFGDTKTKVGDEKCVKKDIAKKNIPTVEGKRTRAVRGKKVETDKDLEVPKVEGKRTRAVREKKVEIDKDLEAPKVEGKRTRAVREKKVEIDKDLEAPKVEGKRTRTVREKKVEVDKELEAPAQGKRTRKGKIQKEDGDKVLVNVEDYVTSNKISTKVMRTPIEPISAMLGLLFPEDRAVCKYVFDETKDGGEILIDYGYIQADRNELKCLYPETCLYDIVIDLVGTEITVQNQKILYLPTNIVNFVDTKNTDEIKLGSPYMHTTYFPDDLCSIEKILVPIHVNDPNHWFMCEINLRTKVNYIYDSLRPKGGINPRQKIVKKVIKLVSTILAKKGSKEFRKITTYPLSDGKVKQQANGYDCGIYVLKFMEATESRVLYEEHFFMDLPLYRFTTLGRLIRSGRNKLRDIVIKKAAVD